MAIENCSRSILGMDFLSTSVGGFSGVNGASCGSSTSSFESSISGVAVFDPGLIGRFGTTGTGDPLSFDPGSTEVGLVGRFGMTGIEVELDDFEVGLCGIIGVDGFVDSDSDPDSSSFGFESCVDTIGTVDLSD